MIQQEIIAWIEGRICELQSMVTRPIPSIDLDINQKIIMAKLSVLEEVLHKLRKK